MDSGATRNFMDLWLLMKDNFPHIRIPEPIIIAYNIDGTQNQKRTIFWKAKTIMALKDLTDLIELMIIRLSQPQVILGMPWLKTWNP